MKQFIRSESDIIAVRKLVREYARTIGFSITDVTRIVTAASELARNVFHYAGSGTMDLETVNTSRGIKLQMIFKDDGPGIENVEQAMEMGYSTHGGMGLGLPGSRRLMDEMEIDTRPGKGTTVRIGKWLSNPLSIQTSSSTIPPM